jgi:hypothetical protein
MLLLLALGAQQKQMVLIQHFFLSHQQVGVGAVTI